MTLSAINLFGHHFALRGLLTAVGSFLLLLTFGLDFSYANLNTYAISYLHSIDSQWTYADWIFVASAKILLQGLCMPLMGYASRLYLGTTKSIIIGSLLFSCGYLLTGLALKSGRLEAVVVTVGVMHGIGMTMCYPQSIGAVLKWFPEGKRGLMGSIAVAGYGFGSVIWNPTETQFVNPENVNPEFEVDGNGTKSRDRYFVDESVLSRVPLLFLLLGGTSLAMQIVAIFLVREPTSKEAEVIFHSDAAASQLEGSAKPVAQMQACGLHPLQVLRTLQFYLIWYATFTISLMIGYFIMYQKAFGQIHVHDDHFLALIAMTANVLNGLARLFWGFMLDKMGYKKCMLVVSGGSSLLCLTFYHAVFPWADDSALAKAFFGVWVCAFYALFPGMYSILAATIMRTFGQRHYEANFGLVFTHMIASSIGSTLLTKLALPILGYMGMFMTVGAIGLTGSIATFFVTSEKEFLEHAQRKFQKSKDAI